jgi:prepilin-type N-terminal cleavage/methylation domain-containing protein
VVGLRAGKGSATGEPPVVAPDPTPASIRRSGSSGFSFVEVLVAVVIVGVTVIATLVGLRTTLISGRVGTERSQLLVWVQEGAEAMHRMPYVPCSPAGPMSAAQADAIRASYQTTLDGVAAPSGMTGGSLSVVDVQFLSIDPATLADRWDDRICDPEFTAALLDIRATTADGTTLDLEVIVDG